MLQANIEAEENIRLKISKDIHDNIGQLLGLAQINMYSLTNELSGSFRISRIMRDTIKIIDRVAQDIHHIGHELNDDHIIAAGFIEIVRNYLDSINISKGIKAQLDIEGPPRQLSKEKEINIFRIIQEALHNILKHADATKITIKFIYKIDSLHLIIADNGKGFDMKSVDLSKGIGIKNLYQRTELLNGHLNIQSMPDIGTTLFFSFSIPSYN